jgi:hypothetical protein
VLKPLLADRSTSLTLGATGKTCAESLSEARMVEDILGLYRSLQPERILCAA